MNTSRLTKKFIQRVGAATGLAAALFGASAHAATTEVCAPPAQGIPQSGANAGLIMSGGGPGNPISDPTDVTSSGQVFDPAWAGSNVTLINLSAEEQTSPQQASIRLLNTTDGNGVHWLYIGGVYSYEGFDNPPTGGVPSTSDVLVFGFTLGAGTTLEHWKFVLKPFGGAAFETTGLAHFGLPWNANPPPGQTPSAGNFWTDSPAVAAANQSGPGAARDWNTGTSTAAPGLPPWLTNHFFWGYQGPYVQFVMGIPITATSDVTHDAGQGGGLALGQNFAAGAKNTGFLFYSNILPQSTFYAPPNDICTCEQFSWPGGTSLLPGATTGSPVETLMPPPATGGAAGSWGAVSFQSDPACMLVNFQATDIGVVIPHCTSGNCVDTNVSIPPTPGYAGSAPGSTCASPPTTPVDQNPIGVNIQNNYPGPANLSVSYAYNVWQLGTGWLPIGSSGPQLVPASTNPPASQFETTWSLTPADSCRLNPGNVSGLSNVVHPCVQATLTGTPVGAGMPAIPTVVQSRNLAWLPASSIADQILLNAPPGAGTHTLELRVMANVVPQQNDVAAFQHGGPGACSATDPNRFQPPCCTPALPGGGSSSSGGGVVISAKPAALAATNQCPGTPPNQLWQTLQYTISAHERTPQKIILNKKACTVYKYYSSAMYRVRHFYAPTDPPYTNWGGQLTGAGLQQVYLASSTPAPGTAQLLQEGSIQLAAGQSVPVGVSLSATNSQGPVITVPSCCTKTVGAVSSYRRSGLGAGLVVVGFFGIRRRTRRTRRKG